MPPVAILLLLAVLLSVPFAGAAEQAYNLIFILLLSPAVVLLGSASEPQRGLGLFDYLPEPDRFARRMYELCSGSVVGSFPKWNWLKGPFRKVRYEWINDCPIFNYSERELRLMFGAAGFSKIEVLRGRSGLLLRADI